MHRAREELLRPLAADPAEVAFWRRHTRTGVVLSVICGVLVTASAWVQPLHPHRVALTAFDAVATSCVLLVLLLPVDRLARARGGRLFPYTWTLASLVITVVATVLDGPAGSTTDTPVRLMYFLSVGFVAVAYPPGAVAVLGGTAVLADLVTALATQVPADRVVVPVGMLATAVLVATWAALGRQELREQHRTVRRELAALADTDPLTGCLNRRAFLHRLQVGIDHPDPVSSLHLVDLDGFKAVNDTAGHAAGDDLLVRVAEAVRRVACGADSVARLGGDEFAVLCRTPDAVAAAALAEAVRAGIARAGAAHGVTASVGSTLLRAGDDPAEAVRRADEAMYAAKARGGDAVVAGADASTPATRSRAHGRRGVRIP
ncbi:GGDEF domain-containing protein [Kineococcus sp. TRM81007]|uniref:GGDEF domain-containing protein n=1 Tax=Kineococcus sp. TRM81007 TaxID=2925831 RepID=UPI001F57BE89|nr:GGDEF domain-containing protein [Kineococcus sp. TRM81007]MCI2239610.1 GGDEF domain-containing protein [Kineococcus sp. TRM81007]